MINFHSRENYLHTIYKSTTSHLALAIAMAENKEQRSFMYQWLTFVVDNQ